MDTGADNEENGSGIWVCDGPTGSWAQAWRHLRRLQAWRHLCRLQPWRHQRRLQA